MQVVSADFDIGNFENLVVENRIFLPEQQQIQLDSFFKIHGPVHFRAKDTGGPNKNLRYIEIIYTGGYLKCPKKHVKDDFVM